MKDTPSSAKDTSEDSLDKEVKDFQDWKKEYEGNEKKELEKDLEELDQRYKPANYSETTKKSIQGTSDTALDQESAESALQGNSLEQEAQETKDIFFPMEATTRHDLYEMERTGADSVELSKWREALPKSEKEIVELNSTVSGKGVNVFDVIDNKDFNFPHPLHNKSVGTSDSE